MGLSPSLAPNCLIPSNPVRRQMAVWKGGLKVTLPPPHIFTPSTHALLEPGKALAHLEVKLPS